jgi:hypothetical protein
MNTQNMVDDTTLENTATGEGQTPERAGESPLASASPERAELMKVLRECGVSVAGFDALRHGAYEKHLAGRSLSELGAFYRRLLNPSEGYEKIQRQCLPWGQKSPRPGKLPSVKALTNIKERLLAEQAMRERMSAKGLLHTRKSGKSEGERWATIRYLNEAMEILGEELLAAKAAGKPMMENLKVLDRLMRARKVCG